MKINVYYGGRGLLDDPTLYVLKKMEDVLRELRVNIERYNIFEHKNEIATLPLTFKDADGIILATPTGSTGYNLSAGGPIINPVSKMIVVTPICAHAIQSKSIILDKDDKISIKVQKVRKTQLEEAFATFDGQLQYVGRGQSSLSGL